MGYRVHEDNLAGRITLHKDRSMAPECTPEDRLPEGNGAWYHFDHRDDAMKKVRDSELSRRQCMACGAL